LRGAAAVHYTSIEEQRDAEATFDLHTGVVIPLGIDPALIFDAPAIRAARQRDRFVLALSRIHPKKNLEALIRAFADVGRSRPEWRLVIAGDGDPRYVQSLKQLVVACDATNCVAVTGWLDGEEKHTRIRNASLFALASFHENFGISVVEAMAAGVPALLSRHVHLAAAVGGADAGWVVDSDVASLRNALAHALDDDEERERKGSHARSLAAQFTWPAIGGQLRQLYLRVTTPPCALGAEQLAPL
jgi:glycosyltransferase involved in cell wall biosynthesis